MNKDVVKNIDKYYGYAKRIAKRDYMDLMHHCLELIPEDVVNVDRYVWVTLRNAYYNKNSSFNKLYGRLQEEADFNTDKIETYDTNILYRIFLELEQEDLEYEVKIFKRCYLFENFTKVSEDTGLSYYKLRQLCDFIQTEIKDRYAKLDQH